MTQAERLQPHPLFDRIKADFNLKNDRALADALHSSPPHVSKMRNRRLDVPDAIILRVHETFNVPVAEIRTLLAAGQPPQGQAQA